MFSNTGIELGPESCVLVRARRRAGAVEVLALHQIERAAWPAHDTALTATLRDLRKSMRFPPRARIVAWHLSAPAAAGDPVVRALVTPITAAGFRVDAVIAPPEALAEIARSRPRPGGSAAVWLALNVHGAAIAIVHAGRLLFGRTFDWTCTAHAVGPRAELLQRYSLVAHLAPEIRRGIAHVRAGHGAVVDAIVTCGDLPDLRSLTMPLIEELDLEVETLDSTDGLVAAGRARSDRFVESAPALRLAAAAAAMPGQPAARSGALRPAVAAAAGMALVAALGWLGFLAWSQLSPAPAVTGVRVASSPPSGPARSTGTRSAESPPHAAAPAPVASAPASTTSPPVTPAGPAVVASHPGVISNAAEVKPPPPTEPQAAAPPVTTSAAVTKQTEAQQTTSEPLVPIETPPASPKPTGTIVPEPAVPPARNSPVPLFNRPLVDSPGLRTDTTWRKPAPLEASLPSVDSILVSADRQVAILDGQIVTVGDRVGPRTVHLIEREAVVLEEPSGHQVRIPIRRNPGGV